MKKPLACFAVLCELCANVPLFLERIPIAQSSQRTAKLAKKLGFGVVSKEGRPCISFRASREISAAAR
jgi:uroporphyrinogen-III synthase